MPQSSGAGIIIRFDEFEVDLTAGQLARNGKRVKVQNLPYRLLVILLERPGEIVAYDELQTGLWGEAAVDVEEGLHTAVRKLRAVLGDSATNPRFIETVPRRGYCFVAPVVKDAIAKTVASSRETEGISGRAWTYISIAGAVLLILASSAALIYRSRGSRGASPEARPITAYRGVQRSPALSPDGTQIVFSWVGEPGDNLDIYKQRIDGSDRVRLTSDPAADQQPAWSRDGKTIAFVRNEALFAVPAIGGRARGSRHRRDRESRGVLIHRRSPFPTGCPPTGRSRSFSSRLIPDNGVSSPRRRVPGRMTCGRPSRPTGVQWRSFAGQRQPPMFTGFLSLAEIRLE